MGLGLNRLDEPVFIEVLKPLQTEFGFNHRLESCGGDDYNRPLHWLRPCQTLKKFQGELKK